jgi:hypothetical protein
MRELNALIDHDNRNTRARVVGPDRLNVYVKAKAGTEVPLVAEQGLVGCIGRLNAGRAHRINGVFTAAMPWRACVLTLGFALSSHYARFTSTKPRLRRCCASPSRRIPNQWHLD